MTFLDSSFSHNIVGDPLFSQAMKDIAKEVDDFMGTFSDNPNSISRWGHNYFCNNDGGRLIFDIRKPHEHVCSICGKVYVGEPWDGVWVYFYRNLAILTALKSATCFRATDDTKYLDSAKTIIYFYAKNYTKFVLHGKDDKVYKDYPSMEWGCGRILPQGLNESIIAIRMIQALELLKDELDDEFLELVHGMCTEMYHLLMPQIHAIHNIPCWNLAALGVMGFFFHDEEILDFVFTSEFNIRRQLQEGVTSDKFWYEGSIHYNFFLLEGVMTLLLFSNIYNYDFGKAETKCIEEMLVNAYSYAFDNHFFPVPNDGWPNINLKTFSYIYYMASKIFGENSVIGNILKNIENDGSVRTTLPLSESYYWHNEIPLERLLFASDFKMDSFIPIKTHSCNFPDSNFSILRQGSLNVFIKYGLNGSSHAHPDIMNIEVAYGKMMISRDLSNAGYQSRLCNEWHRKTLCHNTVECDAMDIPSRKPGKCLKFSEDEISVETDAVYPYANYKRTLHLQSDGFRDVFHVVRTTEGFQDYLFHLESDFWLIGDYTLEEAFLTQTENGYQHILDTKLLCVADDSVCIRATNGAVDIIFDFAQLGNKQFYICRTMDNPVNKTRTTFLIRSREQSCFFEMQMKIKQL